MDDWERLGKPQTLEACFDAWHTYNARKRGELVQGGLFSTKGEG